MATNTRTPAQMVYKGGDSRLGAVRNNLVRKNAQVCENIGKLTDTEVQELVAFIDPEEIVRAAQDVRKAVKERLATAKTAAKSTAA